MDYENIVINPILLDPCNFTSLSKTPWAGKTIWQQYKSTHIPNPESDKIGESWEFSCDPKMPSHLLNDRSIDLPSLIDSHPKEILSPKLFQQQESAHAHILIKLLNAAQPLSFQVHPSDNDPNLQEDECGKPESWLILEAEQGAGIYLGFQTGVTKDKLEEHLTTGRNVEDFFQFIPVSTNDYYDIAPGVAHAIGPGVTLLEPQRINRGQSGKTYRLWDWGRKYRSNGELDPEKGVLRELHIKESLHLLNPSEQSGGDFVKSLKKIPVIKIMSKGIKLFSFPANKDYQTERLTMKTSGEVELDLKDGYSIVFIVKGHLCFIGPKDLKTDIKCGQSALLPHASFPLILHCLESCDLVMIKPSSAKHTWKLSKP